MATCFDYAGVVHVHSKNSDGRENVERIVSAAQEAQCDFLILSDHDTLKALPLEGIYHKTLLLVGEEVTVRSRQGHYLAMNVASEVPPHQKAQATIHQVSAQGGIGFIAHPCAKTSRRLLSLGPCSWKNWHAKGFSGLEIWNYSQNWKDHFDGILPHPSGVVCTRSYAHGPFTSVIRKWDELLRYQKVVGIGGVDAHGYIHSYREMFKTLRTHILPAKALSFHKSSFKEDKRLIYHALQKGNCYFSNDLNHNARGFLFSASNGKNQVIMGEELVLMEGVTLTVSSPEAAVLRIVKDRKEIAGVAGARELHHSVHEPGAYRAEVYLTDKNLRKAYRPWIFSNPIYLLN
ncbi:hypothetical protein [Candidatus Formimonas warabiya]|uniref:Polymerase/histidinol phosphatase N-terminal domain-containing protein n=1 Tax=Formimonas warabiya TaxID=1761012 RepID=A0A3G1KVU0_FORW1|nr:hypothetical protein [Candidatus Formimonas warabiya]ATW26530.1 hypothetical protein DCMF_18830 [Candidatus Formimonas warabiya]